MTDDIKVRPEDVPQAYVDKYVRMDFKEFNPFAEVTPNYGPQYTEDAYAARQPSGAAAGFAIIAAFAFIFGAIVGAVAYAIGG